MDFNKASAWAIRNPIFPILAFIGLMVAGIMSFQEMDIQDNPDIEFPVVMVSISQPGAAPSEVVNQITQRVEAAVQTLDGVENIYSSASEGNSFTSIEFAIGTDVDDAVNQVKGEIDNIRGELPDGILEPRISKQATSSRPIVSFGVSADDMTLEQLSWFIDDVVTKRLLSVNGLAEVSRSGGVDREILVILDPARMQSLGVTASQVNSALRQLNVNAAGGQAEIAGSRQSVRVLGNAESAYDLSQTLINIGGGRSVKLSDIARVQDSFGEVRTLAKVDGKQVVTFSITRARGESDVRVYDEAVEVLQQVQDANPGVTFTRLFTEVDYTKGQYESSMALLVEGALLAVVVVFLFLRDWRATIIAALAIPLSAIPTFYFMEAWFGFSLNTMSLLALGLVAGVLVDDAIVEIENIVRHMRMGKSAYQSSIDAADEIGLPVVATTFCIVAVFLPVGLMPGISGEFFKNFGLTVVVAVLMSLAVARLITPMAAAYFLKAKGHATHGEGPMMDRYMKVLRWSLDTSWFRRKREEYGHTPTHWAFHLAAVLVGLAIFAALTGPQGLLDLAGFNAESAGGALGSLLLTIFLAYVTGGLVNFIVGMIFGLVIGYGRTYYTARVRFLATRFLDHRVWMMLLGFVALGLTVVIAGSLPQQFFPDNDSDFSRVSVSMVPGTTLEQTEAVIDRIAERLSEEQEVALALGIANEGSGRISMVLRDDRERTSLEFERELTPVLQDIPDARVNFQNNQDGGGGTGRAISIMLAGSDPDLLQEAANDLVQQMETVEGAVAPRIDYDLQRPELIINPREDLAASLGVTTVALSQAIRIATLGDIDQNAAKFSLSDRQIPIRVRLAESARRDLATIRNLPVPTANGGSVPLSRVADISLGMGPTSIERFNQNRRVFVGVDVAPNFARGTVLNAINALPIMDNLPTGVQNLPVGADEWQADLITNFIIAVITGLFLVFAVLVLLYRRIVSPLVNMSSLALAPLGGFLALVIFGLIKDGQPMPISMPVFIGMLMLLGIVAKNSILLIDFAIEEMDAGADKLAAIIEAGHKRAQPIVMTTVAMTAGMVPTALSLTGDSAWRAPMGAVVIGGLILSTALTLVIVPAGFSLADGLEKKLGPWLRERLLTYRPGDETATGAEPQPAE